MELEEMKTLWAEMSAEVDRQGKLNAALITGITQLKYKGKLNKILLPEAVSSALALGFVLFILFNLQKLDTWYLLACGIISALILVILPVLSLRSIYRMNNIDIGANTFRQTLAAFARGKLQFVFAQRLSFYLGAVLMLTVLPAMVALMGGSDPFKKTAIWLIYVIMYPFFHLFVRWVFKKYLKITNDAEALLKELEG